MMRLVHVHVLQVWCKVFFLRKGSYLRFVSDMDLERDSNSSSEGTNNMSNQNQMMGQLLSHGSAI